MADEGGKLGGEGFLDDEVRRAATVALVYEDGVLVGGNYWLGTHIKLAAREAHAVERLGTYTPVREALRIVPPGEPERPITEAELVRLVAGGLLVRRTVGEADAERFCSHWRDWGVATRIYHATARYAAYADDNRKARVVYDAMVAQGPPPASLKRYPAGPVVALPRERKRLDVPLEAVLASRRTFRAFTGEEIDLPTLATLLELSFGVQHRVHAVEYGDLLFKTSPSGGARHPTEAYVFALAVDGLSPAIYHYDPLGHALRKVGEDPRAHMTRWLAGQSWFEGSAVVVVLTAVVERLAYKYKHGRAYRVLLLDQGHLGQTFTLVATALDLGPFETHVFREEEVAKALGLDGITEVPLYVLGAGVPPVAVLDPEARCELFGEREPTTIHFPVPG